MGIYNKKEPKISMYYAIQTDREIGNIIQQCDLDRGFCCEGLSPKNYPNTSVNLVLRKDPRANITDIMSCSIIGKGLLINDKCEQLIKEFNIIRGHTFYPTTIKTRKHILNYKWINLPNSETEDNTVYSKSKFVTEERSRGIVVKTSPLEIVFNDYSEYLDYFFKNRNWWSKTVGNDLIVINDISLADADLFYLSTTVSSVTISQRLFDAMIENKISGWEVKEKFNIEFVEE